MQIVTHTYTVTYDPDGAGPEREVTRTVTEVDYIPEPSDTMEARTVFFDDRGNELSELTGAEVSSAPSADRLANGSVFEIEGAIDSQNNVLPNIYALRDLVESSNLPNVPLDLSGVTFAFDLDLESYRAAGIVPAMGTDSRWDRLFDHANLQDTQFEGTVTGVNFYYADLTRAQFDQGVSHCHMQEVLLINATLAASSENTFIGANLSGATLTGEWNRNNFLYAEFTDTDLLGVTSMQRNSFAHANIAGARFPAAWTNDPNFTLGSVFTGTGLPQDDGLAALPINDPQVLTALGGPAGIAALAAVTDPAQEDLFEALDRVLRDLYGEGLDGRLNEYWRSVLWDSLIRDPTISPLKAFVFDEPAGPHDGNWGRGYEVMLATYGEPTLDFWYNLQAADGTYPARDVIEQRLIDMLLASSPAYLDDPFMGTRTISSARQP